MQVKRYGWIRDNLDKRDIHFSQISTGVMPIPKAVDLRNQCPPIVDQGELGSCTANALAGAIHFIHKDLISSRLFIYYNERIIEHTISSDSGAQIRDGIKTLTKQGVCSENIWPYNIDKFKEHPPIDCYNQAKIDIVKSYHRITGLYQMKYCLSQGFPFVFGFSVYESFENKHVAKTGILPLPSSDEQLLGGHAVLAVGYDMDKQMMLVRNSWGDSWGIKGYFWMPFSYINDSQLADDMWTIRS